MRGELEFFCIESRLKWKLLLLLLLITLGCAREGNLKIDTIFTDCADILQGIKYGKYNNIWRVKQKSYYNITKAYNGSC